MGGQNNFINLMALVPRYHYTLPFRNKHKTKLHSSSRLRFRNLLTGRVYSDLAILFMADGLSVFTPHFLSVAKHAGK